MIVHERDREKLLEKVCHFLVEARGYHNAWIILLDEEGKPVHHTNSVLGEEFDLLVEVFKRGFGAPG